MSNKQSKVLIGAATLAAAVAGAGNAAIAATDDLTMTAKILAPVQITQTKSLQFGSATVAAGSAGTITVGLADTRSAGGGVSLVGGTTAQSGSFKVIAAAGKQVKITVPAADTVKNTAGATTMSVTGFDIEGGGTSYVHTQASAAGDTGIDVGAVLNVAAGQAPGNYTGTVTVTAVYQ